MKNHAGLGPNGGRLGLRRSIALALAALAGIGCAVWGGGGDPALASQARAVLSSPVAPLKVERLASLPPQPWLAGHRGIDIEAVLGDDVTAPDAGVISFAGFVVNRPVVSIRHGRGLVTSLEPVDATVAVGEAVTRGETVGTVSASAGHCAPRTCIHWGLRLDGVYVDPLDYLEGFGPIRLLPMPSD